MIKKTIAAKKCNLFNGFGIPCLFIKLVCTIIPSAETEIILSINKHSSQGCFPKYKVEKQ